MATFKHALPGSVTASKRVIVSDALTSSSTTKFTMTQPAESIIDEIIVRALDTFTITSGNCGVTVGTTDGGTEIHTGSATNLINGSTSFAAGGTQTFAPAAAYKYNVATSSVTTDERAIHFTVTTSTAVAASGNGKMEFTVVYRIFD